MSATFQICLLGWGTTPNWEFPGVGLPLHVAYVAPEVAREMFGRDIPFIYVEWGPRGTQNADGPTKPPKEMLEHREIHLVPSGKGGQVCEEEPAGWFERKCAEAHCSWFVPIVRRMAAGEEVSLEEIRATFREHNGGSEMPCGGWQEVFAAEDAIGPLKGN